jgi:hypothetical protein
MGYGRVPQIDMTDAAAKRAPRDVAADLWTAMQAPDGRAVDKYVPVQRTALCVGNLRERKLMHPTSLRDERMFDVISGAFPGLRVSFRLGGPTAGLAIPEGQRCHPWIAGAAAYSSSVTCSPQLTGLPESSASCIAVCVMKRLGAAPCQWTSPGSK